MKMAGLRQDAVCQFIAGTLLLMLGLCFSVSWAACIDGVVGNVPNSQQCEITTASDLDSIRDDVTGLSLAFTAQHNIDFTKEGVIPALSKLTTLQLDLTHVDELGGGLFIHVYQMEKLTMYRRTSQQHLVLPDLIFKDLRELTTLSLSRLDIEVIESQALRDLVQLRTLDLGSNAIKTIPEDTFKDCEKLYSIVMYKNKVENLSELSFSGLENLDMLDLSENQIKILENRQLQELSNLRELSIEYSSVTEIEPGAFQGMAKLMTLFLGENLLSELPPDSFQGLSSLQTLHLNHNSALRKIDKAFLGLNSLTELKLDDCNLSSITALSFSGLDNLNILRLDNNKLEMLTDNQAFVPLSNLRELTLEGNGMYQIHHDAFKGLSHLKKLDLSYNRLTLLPDGLLKHFTNLTSIRLVGNRWDCRESELSELINWYSRKLEEAGDCDPGAAEEVFEDGEEVACHTPDQSIKLSSVVSEKASELCVAATKVEEEQSGLSLGAKAAIIVSAVAVAIILVVLVVLLVVCRTRSHGMWTPTKTQKRMTGEDRLRYTARAKTATKTPSVYWDAELGPTAMDQADHAYMNHGFSNPAMDGDDSLAPKHRNTDTDVHPPSYDVVMKKSTASVSSDGGAIGPGTAGLHQHENDYKMRNHKGKTSCDSISDPDIDGDQVPDFKTNNMRLEMKVPLESSEKEHSNPAYIDDSNGCEKNCLDDNVFVDEHNVKTDAETEFSGEEVRAVHRRKSSSSESDYDHNDERTCKDTSSSGTNSKSLQLNSNSLTFPSSP